MNLKAESKILLDMLDLMTEERSPFRDSNQVALTLETKSLSVKPTARNGSLALGFDS